MPSVSTHIKTRLAVLHPAYFALVMSTGIVAIASDLLGLSEFAIALSLINMVVYPALWVLFIARAVMFRKQTIADFMSHKRAPGYFTVVAATAVLGTQMVLLFDSFLVAKILWWISIVLFGICTYTVFTLLTVCKEKVPLEDGINGAWLVAVVATQSVCVLGCSLGGNILSDQDSFLFLLMSFWLFGGMLYFWIISLIFYRYMFFPLSPRDLMPPYWINMGAVAISTLAGALLANATENSVLLGPLRPFILGLTIMFWATATWWIPMLLILGCWRHLIRKFPISYDPLYWGMVFPLGMYTVCTFKLAEVLDITFLMWIVNIFIIAAITAWLFTFFGLARQILFVVRLGLRSTRFARLYEK